MISTFLRVPSKTNLITVANKKQPIRFKLAKLTLTQNKHKFKLLPGN